MTLPEKAEGKQERPEAVSDAPSPNLRTLLRHRGLLLRRLISCRMIDGPGNCF